MKEIIAQIIRMYENYMGESLRWCLVVFSFFALIFLVLRKRTKQAVFFGLFAAFWLLIYACPVTAGIIMKYCIGKSVYWRMFWILPAIPMTAYVFTKLTKTFQTNAEDTRFRAGKRILSLLLFVCCMASIIGSGSLVFDRIPLDFTRDRTKIDPKVIKFCQLVQEDAKNRGVETITAVVPDDFLCYVRQYDASIHMPYGREVQRLEKENEIFDLLHDAEGIDAKALVKAGKENQCNYIYLQTEENSELDKALQKEGLELAASKEEFLLYYLPS